MHRQSPGALIQKDSREIGMTISSATVRQDDSFHSMPRWSRAALLLVAVAMSGVQSTHVSAEDSILTWIVQSVSAPDEDGEIIKASTMQVPQVGTRLVTGQDISTGSGQQMVLVNGRDLVVVSPNTTVTIGDNDPSTAQANVDVATGAIHVEVGKRAPGHTFS